MIGIIAAMRAEVDALRREMHEVCECEHDGICFWEGRLAQMGCVLMLSGVGKGHAALATTLLLKNYDIEAVWNIGTAGGLQASEQILDLVISDQIIQHDYDTSAIDGEAGIGLAFQADAYWIDLCKRVLAENKERYHCGLMLSGDQFISDPVQFQALLRRYPQALCAEMEAGAVAQVCTHFHKPFVILRSLSDIALHAENQIDFNTYVHQASRRSAQLCVQLMKKHREGARQKGENRV